MTRPAIVMGLTETGLSIARALGRRRIEVIGINPDRLAPTYSRFLKYVQEPNCEREEEKLNFYLNLGKKFDSKAILFPTGDPNVTFISRNRDILEKYFLFLIPSQELLDSIVSKRDLISASKKYGLRLPPAVLPASRGVIKALPSSMFPCVIKPEFTYLWRTEKAYSSGLGGLKAIPIENNSELLSQYDRVSKIDGRVVIQKMVVGPDENHIDYHALVQPTGKICGEFVGRKLRLTPPHFGMGCYVESIKSEETVEEGRKLLRLLNYRGMANINFKKDERDGQLYFLELNPRFSFWTGLDVACGVDFPYYYYKTCLGESFKIKIDYTLGKRWINLLRDIRGLRVYMGDGTISLWQWIKSISITCSGAVFAFDDPLPSIISLYKFAKGSIYNRLRKSWLHFIG